MTIPERADEDARAVLFIGDSITAAGRVASDPSDLGDGYVALVTEELGRRHPASSVLVRNRGVSGDRACDVEARWRRDCLDLDPGVITLLVGVNDTWRRFDRGLESPPGEFAASLRRMVRDARERTSAAIVLVEPFILTVGFVTAAWEDDLAARRAVVEQVAYESDATFVATQSAFEDAAGADPASLLDDGVHPTPAGHRLLATRWLAAVDIDAVSRS